MRNVFFKNDFNEGAAFYFTILALVGTVAGIVAIALAIAPPEISYRFIPAGIIGLVSIALLLASYFSHREIWGNHKNY